MTVDPISGFRAAINITVFNFYGVFDSAVYDDADSGMNFII
jgi:hypothetical protein